METSVFLFLQAMNAFDGRRVNMFIINNIKKLNDE